MSHPSIIFNLPVYLLWTSLISLIIISSFFSLAETAYMSVNRYRLMHLARSNHSGAKYAQLLLDRPDRLLGLILFCDTFSDILASAISTVLAVHYFGELGILLATLSLTFIILVFGELSPKTLAALYPMPIVLATARSLWILLNLFNWIIRFINFLSNGLLRLFGMSSGEKNTGHLTMDELRIVITDSSRHLSENYQRMLLQLLDLEKIHIEDIMVARQDIIGIDINKPFPDILEQLMTNQHTRMPVYQEHLDNIIGILHIRDSLNLLADQNFTLETLKGIIEEPYFIPQGTPLSEQLVQFCQRKVRTGLVVNEYGDILGLAALEDILEEIVGEFTTDTASAHKNILPQKDNSYLIDGSVNLRVLNRTVGSNFDLNHAKTLSGLIIEYLENIPPSGSCVKIAGFYMEILQVKDNTIKTIRIWRPEL